MYSTKSGSELKLRRKQGTSSAAPDPDILSTKSNELGSGPTLGDELYRKPTRSKRESAKALNHPWPVLKRTQVAKPAPWKTRTRKCWPSMPTLLEGYIELAPDLLDRFEQRQEQHPVSPYQHPSWMWQFDLLWLLAILVYGVGDIVTSNMAFSVGASELNPFLYPLINDSVWNFVKFKAMVLIALMLLSTWLITVESDARVVPLFTLAVGLFLIANNLIVMGRLQGWI